MKEKLRTQAADFPDKPGLYVFKNAAGEVLYIGKARCLRERIRSYFLPRPDLKVRRLLEEAVAIDYLLTGTEKEAAFLENNYIQQHQPKFNVKLKDDKSFPYLRLTVRDQFPGLYFSRTVEEDGARYFGPFNPAGRARRSIHLVNKHFGIRGCEEAVFRNRKRPCLEYDLGLCSAPCAGFISEDDYRDGVKNARLFLEGRTAELKKSMKRKMDIAAKSLQFEEAASLRDFIRTLDDIKRAPRTISVGLEDLDAAGFARIGDAAAVHLFFMRRGKIRDSKDILVDGVAGKADGEILGDLLGAYYSKERKPPTILLPFEPACREELANRIARERESRPRLIVARSKKRAGIIDLANKNAELAIRKRERDLSPLHHLAQVLGWKRPPQRIEGFDISNTGGDESVGSLVVFENGVPNKEEYRKFKIRTVQGPNDVASLEEVVRRRCARTRAEGRPLPDLIFVDGGKAQRRAALRALGREGLKELPVISLAKKEEIIFTPVHENGLRLDRTSPALKLVQHVRDEAHRFAVTFHRQRREKKSFASELDGIPGLGPKKKALLLKTYGSLENIRQAAPAELAALIGHKLALRLSGERMND